MDKSSAGQIKLSGFLSDKFDIRKGTEQGHPLSPDVFKIYIRDLSPCLEHVNCPKLLYQIHSIISNNIPESSAHNHPIAISTNFLRLIKNDNDIIKPLPPESQAHLTRVIARFITNSLNNRKKLFDSLNT